MQSATCGNLRIRSPSDVRIVFHAVLLNILPMVTRRLDSEERGLIAPGSVYVWEERGAHTEITGVGIERWTDGNNRAEQLHTGIRWGPSRVREGFLFYHEKPSSHYVFPGGIYPSHRQQAPQELLIKQTYTAFVDTPRGQRKWHLIAYFTEESVDRLNCIDDYPDLSSLHVPHGKYKSARSVKGRPDHIFNPDDSTEITVSEKSLLTYLRIYGHILCSKAIRLKGSIFFLEVYHFAISDHIRPYGQYRSKGSISGK
ncbi:Gti1/Pac2 family-domain-containing protein [Mycena olivaceomarginata]|nr:Gti1/Pac2 family-domain-containing protein [Mycena olivaceomarginata]